MEYKWVVLTVTSVGAFMANLDSRIVIVGLPTIGRELGIGLTELVWVTQVYVLVACILSLLIGRMSDVVGRLKIYNIGFGIFTIGSALSAFSFSGPQLIAGRAVQGVGAAMLVGNSAAMLTDAAKGKDLGTLLGANMMVGYVGSFSGLTLSGIILSITDWRALFYINIPVGIFAVFWCNRRLHEISVKDIQRKIDWIGFFMFSGGITMLLLSITLLTYGPQLIIEGISILTGAVFLILMFAWKEGRTEVPLLDLTLFKIRRFAAGNVAWILQGIPWVGMTILASFYLQLGLGLSPLQAGLAYIPVDATLLVTGFAGGWLSDKYGRRNLFSAASIIVCFVGYILMAFVATDGNEFQFVAALMLAGVGAGVYLSPNSADVMDSVPAERRGVANGVRATIQYFLSSFSYGWVVLLLTLGIPYGTLTSLIQSGEMGIDLTIQAEFLQGTRLALLALAIINLVALVPQLLATSPKRKITDYAV